MFDLELFIGDLFTSILYISVPLSDIQSDEDCRHDVFVDFAGAIDGLMINNNLKSYLISYVANRAWDQLRKKSSRNVNQAGYVHLNGKSTRPKLRHFPMEAAPDTKERSSVRLLGAVYR